MAKFEDLAFKEAAHEAATGVGEMPEERGGSKPNLAQARYIFVLPANVAELVTVRENVDLGDRVVYDFSSEGLAAYNGARDYVGQWFGRISGVPRNKAKTGEPKRLVSEVTYLLGAFGAVAKPITLKPLGVTEWVMADSQKALHELVVAHAGQQFSANNEWSAYCNPKKTRYINDGAGGSAEDPSGQKGCGNSVYSRDIPRDAAGVAQDRFYCKCGAALLAFQNLANFGPAPKG